MSISMKVTVRVLALAALGTVSITAAIHAQQATMSFFVTSAGKGDGANLGGLEGADAHCQALAKAAGSAKMNWKAYLSTTAPGGEAGVNARDRIGKGPWQNAKGAIVAKSVDDLHSDIAAVWGRMKDADQDWPTEEQWAELRAADRLDPLGPDETLEPGEEGRVEVTFDLPMPSMSSLRFTPAG